MTVLTETVHEAEGLLAEFDPDYNREVGTVASGQNLVAGQVVAISATKLVAMPGTLDTAGDLTGTAVGILLRDADASATGTNADIKGVPYIARGPAAYRASSMTFPTETTEGDEQAQVTAQLLTLGIVVR